MNFTSQSTVLFAYCPNVDIVGDGAFSGFTGLKRFISKKLQKIGSFGFYKCTTLEEIDLKSVTSIET